MHGVNIWGDGNLVSRCVLSVTHPSHQSAYCVPLTSLRAGCVTEKF
jgi:hypothetical protein